MSAQPSNLHRELAQAKFTSDERREFAIFALGWFGNAAPAEAAACLKSYLSGRPERRESAA